MIKNKIINKTEEFILDNLEKTKNDKNISKFEKIEAYNVYFNIYKFLKDYDKNIQILQTDHIKNKYEGRE